MNRVTCREVSATRRQERSVFSERSVFRRKTHDLINQLLHLWIHRSSANMVTHHMCPAAARDRGCRNVGARLADCFNQTRNFAAGPQTRNKRIASGRFAEIKLQIERARGTKIVAGNPQVQWLVVLVLP